jgi:hypothetical protein
VDLRAPLDHIIDPIQVAEALEWTHLVLLVKVAEDEDARRRMSTMLREFYDIRGDAPAGLAHGLQRGHGLSAAGPSRVQIQQSPSSSQGQGGRGQGGRTPSCNARGRRTSEAGRDRQPRQVPVPAAELRPQAR